ncbi:hypothetical protein ACFOY4_41320 [Actinomadura syzygii]|uniref:Uncharacterized protein n=1 Tax=Actinomadura syzygii TaxID=1427538 RepID=A0A5D0TRN3_9ACTN|nr:hypothetical protein [Actinomadura syzygii]TYC07569.1 hypothetical protein FXF65_41925 [Actinomadura syzygii]
MSDVVESGTDELDMFVPLVTSIPGVAPELVRIAEQYWDLVDIDADIGPRWQYGVREIDTAGWGRRLHVIAAAGARATLTDIACPECDQPLRLRTRTDLATLVTGGRASCVDCDPRMGEAIDLILDPARAVKRARAYERESLQRAQSEARCQWIDRCDEIIATCHPVTLVEDFPGPAALRTELAVLAFLRYAPSQGPLTPLVHWQQHLHPDIAQETVLLGDAVATGLLGIHPDSPPDAFVWKQSYDEALRAANGDLVALAHPALTSHYYPARAVFYARHGTSTATALANTDEWLACWLAHPDRMKIEQERAELLDVAGELMADEAVRFFNMQLERHHLPPTPANHRRRLHDALQKAALHRTLGQLFSLGYRAARNAAASAQEHQRAPLANMSTHGVNRFEGDAHRAAAEPDWRINGFPTLYGMELAAMTRTLFLTVLDLNPLSTSGTEIARIVTADSAPPVDQDHAPSQQQPRPGDIPAPRAPDDQPANASTTANRS